MDNTTDKYISANILAVSKGGGDYTKTTAPDEYKTEGMEGLRRFMVSLVYEEDIIVNSDDEAVDLFISALLQDKEYATRIIEQNTDVVEL